MIEHYSQEMLTKHNCFMLQTPTPLDYAIKISSSILDININLENLNSFGNIFLIQGDNSIKIEDVEIIKSQFYVSGLGDKKIFIILEPEKLTKSASNSLLKILEDSDLSNIFIFASKNSKNVIQTINSRCVKLCDAEKAQDNSDIKKLAESLFQKKIKPEDIENQYRNEVLKYILQTPSYFSHLNHEEYLKIQSKIDYYLKHLTNNKSLKALIVLLQYIWQS